MAVNLVEGLVDVVVIVEDEGISLEEETRETGEMDSLPDHTPLPARPVTDPDPDPARVPVLLHPAALADSPTAIANENETGVIAAVIKGQVNRLEIDHETMDGLPAAAVVVLPPTLGKGITVARPHLTVLPHHPLLRAKREVEARAGVDPSHVLLLRLVVPVHARVLDLDPSHARCLLVHVHVPLRLPLFVCAVPTDTNTDVGHLVVVGARVEAVVEVEVEAGVGEGVIPHHVRKLENTHDPCPDREHGPAHDLDLEHLSDDGRGITLPHLNFKGMTRVRGDENIYIHN